MLAALKQFVRQRAKALLRHQWRPIIAPYTKLFDPSYDPSHYSLLNLVEASETGPLLLWPPRPIPSGPTEVVVVSPHLDDAPLSLGGRMLQWGRRCTVLDLFSTVSWWRLPIDSYEDPRIQQCRDAEEDLMAHLTGATIRRVGLPEAPRRGYALSDIFTTEILPTEAAGETIRAAVTALAGEGAYQWFLPLCVGNHVDHRIARDASLDALLAANVSTDRIRFYEDLPYATKTPGFLDYGDFVPGRKLELAELTPINVTLKKMLLRAYWSQLTNAQITAVADYAQRSGRITIERVWKLS